jgi:hypothetical protein
MISISIPVKKHVKKYLIKKYGATHTVSKKTFLGLLVLELISDQVEPSDRQFLEIEKYEMQTERFLIKRFISIKTETPAGNTYGKAIPRGLLRFVDMELAKAPETLGNPFVYSFRYIKFQKTI